MFIHPLIQRTLKKNKSSDFRQATKRTHIFSDKDR